MATKKAVKSTRKQARKSKAAPAAKKSGGTAGKRAAAKRPAPTRAAPPASPAPMERTGLMELSGKPATIIGADVAAGQPAPDFTAQVGAWAGKDLWQELSPLAETAGKVRILAAVPSLDTNTCNIETRRFNEEAAALDNDIVIITISTDLPPAQKRWCGAAGVERVRVVSDHMATEFGERYGTLMKERRWLRRAVFVVDRAGTVVYAAYMPKNSVEPDYPAVLAAARQALEQSDGQGAKGR
jgi:thioredoxin-dependent peroxiredoxin